MTVQDSRLYRPFPPGRRSSTARVAYLVIAFVELFALLLVCGVPFLAYGVDLEPPDPVLLPGLTFVQAAVIVTSIVVGLLARSCLVRDHVEVRRVRQLYPVAMSCFVLAATVLVAMSGGALFGPDVLKEYLGGDFFAVTAANTAMLPTILSGLLTARLHALKKI